MRSVAMRWESQAHGYLCPVSTCYACASCAHHPNLCCGTQVACASRQSLDTLSCSRGVCRHQLVLCLAEQILGVHRCVVCSAVLGTHRCREGGLAAESGVRAKSKPSASMSNQAAPGVAQAPCCAHVPVQIPLDFTKSQQIPLPQRHGRRGPFLGACGIRSAGSCLQCCPPTLR